VRYERGRTRRYGLRTHALWMWDAFQVGGFPRLLSHTNFDIPTQALLDFGADEDL
jgi:hypothetical protein